MGVLIAGGLTGLLNQSSAQVIDGSVKFDKTSSTYLTRTPASAGNRKVWTLSYWIKLSGDAGHLLSANNDAFQFEYRSTGQLLFANSGSTSGNTLSTALFRDPGAFYHIVIQHDAVNTISRFYINGEQNFTATLSNADGTWNNNTSHNINGRSTSNDSYADFGMSQVYFIDGQALGPGYFGFTDPLTGTWRPKKVRQGDTSPVNDGTVWSSGTKTTTGSGLYSGSWDKAFDGNLNIGVANGAPYVYNNSSATLTFPKPLTGYISVFGSNGSNSATDSAGTDQIILSDGSVFDVSGITVPNGKWYNFGYKKNITSIRIEDNGSSGQGTFLRAIAINGVELLDNDTSSVDFGTNGFYLPMDGNSSIGDDKSGKGNNWTPVNFGSSVGLDKATGALPILNTVSGGNYATVGVRTDANAANLVLALPLVGSANDLSNSVNSGTTTKTTTVSGATASTAESNIYGGSFIFDGSNDEITVGGVSTDLDFGTGDYTAEAWFRLTATGDEYIISMGTDHGGAAPHWGINIYSTNLIRAGRTNSSGDASHSVSHTFITNKWYHVAISRSGGTSRLFLDGNLLDEESNSDDIDPTTDLKIGRYGPGAIYYNGYIQDVRIYKGVGKYTESFNPPSTNPDILPDTPSGVSGGSKLAKVTDGAVSFDGTGDYLNLANSSDFVVGTGDFTMECYIYQKSQGGEATVFGLKHTGGSGWTGYKFYITTSGNFTFYAEDAGSGDWDIGLQAGNGSVSLNRWHHLSATRNGTTFRVFVDGILKASTTSSVDLNDGGDGFYISNNGGNQQYFNGIISNIRIIKGTALYTTDFTPPTRTLTNVTNTKLLCCQSNTSTIEGAVKPGTITANGDVVATNFNPFNTDINAVRGQETGYATLNPLAKNSSYTLSNGNLSYSGSVIQGLVASTIFASSGKYYCEFQLTTQQNDTGIGVGDERINPTEDWIGEQSYQVGYLSDGRIFQGSSATTYSGYGTSDTIGAAFDVDTGKVYFAKNNIWQNSGNPAAGTGQVKTISGGNPLTFTFRSVSSGAGTVNFGQKPFKFPPPAGFQSLNAASVRPETVITRPDHYYGIVTYTGTGSAFNINYNFSPDFAWIKGRTFASNHQLSDTVRNRAEGGNRRLELPTTQAQDGGGPGFINSGLNINTGAAINTNDQNFVAWAWKAGGNKNTFNKDDVGYASAAAAGLTGGSITPTGSSVGTKQGFSIIQYTGTDASSNTFSHGLSQKPNFAIFKNLSQSGDDFIIYHSSLGATKRMKLNSASTADSQTSQFNDTEPTSSLFTIGTYDNINKLNNNYISYIWHDVPGLQKFGSYVGNANTDGTFVELGFRPRWIMQKNISGQEWFIHDTARDPVNVAGFRLVADINVAENGTNNTWLDILSNGFKLRTTNEAGNSGTFIYMAWAEAPAFNLYGGQSNAR